MTAAGHVDLIRMMGAHYRPYGWTDDSIEGYLIAVGDLDIDLVRRAVVDTIRTVEKMPSGAELRRVALQLVAGIGPPDVDSAWAEVLIRFGTHGRLRDPNWSHPLIAETVESLGGWARMCVTDDVVGTRIRFTRAYQTYTVRAERLALASPALSDLAALVGAGLPALPATTHQENQP